MSEANFHFESIRLVILDGNRQVRQALVSHLFHHGFRDIVDTDRLSDVEERLATDTVDLLIATTGEVGDLTAAGLLRKSRQQEIGRNPFVVAILVIANATEDVVRAALDAGPDAVLASPVSVGDLYKRITLLIRERKPFVVTSDYIGPDRRKGNLREGSEEIPLITVPNALRAKATGQGLGNLGKQFAHAARVINSLRIQRAARQVLYVGSRLTALPKDEAKRPVVIADFQRMKTSLADLRRRIVSTPYAEIEATAAGLADVLETLGSDPTGAAEDALRQSASLAETLYQATEEARQRAQGGEQELPLPPPSVPRAENPARAS
jgi:DNA-binding response OmpR family regulator